MKGLLLVPRRTAASLASRAEKNPAASLSRRRTKDGTGACVFPQRNVKERSRTRLRERPLAAARRESSAEEPQTGVRMVRHTRQSRGPLTHRGAPLYPGVCPCRRCRLSAPRAAPPPQGCVTPTGPSQRVKGRYDTKLLQERIKYVLILTCLVQEGFTLRNLRNGKLQS